MYGHSATACISYLAVLAMPFCHVADTWQGHASRPDRDKTFASWAVSIHKCKSINLVQACTYTILHMLYVQVHAWGCGSWFAAFQYSHNSLFLLLSMMMFDDHICSASNWKCTQVKDNGLDRSALQLYGGRMQVLLKHVMLSESCMTATPCFLCIPLHGSH